MKKLIYCVAVMLLTVSSFAGLKADKEKLQQQLMEEATTVKSREEYMNLLKKQDKMLSELIAKYDLTKLAEEDKLPAIDILLVLKKPQKALEVIKTLTGEQAKDVVTMYYAKIYLAMNDILNATKYLNEMDKNSGQYASICAEYGYGLLQKNKMKEGVEYFEKALGSKGIDLKLKAQIVSILSNVYDSMGNKEKLTAFLDKYIADKTVPVQITARLQSIKKRIEMEGKPAIEISGVDTWINSNPLQLEKLKGKVVVLDFFAPWCGPCRMAMPVLNDLYKKHKDKLVVIGITPLEGRFFDGKIKEQNITKERELELIKNFLKEKEYPVAVTKDKDLVKQYGVSGIPHFVIIDKNGNVAKVIVGFSGAENFAKTIESYLK